MLREFFEVQERGPGSQSQPATNGPITSSLLPEQPRKDSVVRDLADWKQHLSSLPRLNLPTNRPRLDVPAADSESRSSCIDKKLWDALRSFSREEQVPLSIVLLAAFQVLLLRYTSQEEIITACSLPDLQEAWRPCANEFVLRSELSGDPGFRAFLQHLKMIVLGASSEILIPVAEILQALTADSAILFFQVSFSYRTLIPDAVLNSAARNPLIWNLGLDLHLQVEDGGEGTQLRISYNPELFDASSIDRALSHFQILLQGIVQDPDQTLSRLPILTQAEKRQILVEWNQTDATYPQDKCLHELIEQQAEALPEKPAVISGTRVLTYREFNLQANQLAEHLQKHGVGPNVRVAICLAPSAEFAVAVLGVLKSGAACVPLDPNYPSERLAYMLEDVQAQILITEKGILPDGTAGRCEVFSFSDHPEIFSSQPRPNPISRVSSKDIAYVIYTSGSTGKPRGVLLRHSGLVNYITNVARMYSITPGDRVLQFCSISFDIALEELFITWLSGATLVFRCEDMPIAVPEFLSWIKQNQVTVLDLPTAYWHEWVHEFPELEQCTTPELRLVIVGGEKPSLQAYTRWFNAVGRRVRWINTYGPTETSICATAFEPDFNTEATIPANIPIGRPLANTRVYVLDRHLNPVPIGVCGELYIGGAGVAQGYFNRPELTQEKFIPDPFCSKPEARLYKTGDLARYLPSGEIEFLGRSDHQIKVRGFRIELGEVETTLAKHPAVREVAVIAREDIPGDKRLAAYLVLAAGATATTAELRLYLQEQLPDYMVPGDFVVLQTMPLTPNGKINRRELPAPEIAVSRNEIPAPNDPLQAQLVEIWQNVLGKKPIAIRDNFFELGGHSLLAARLMHRIGKALGKTLPLAMLFQAPTVDQLATILRQDEWSQHWSSLVPIQPAGSQPPFFCAHGVGGNVLGFHELARRMAPDYPFYGLQSRGLNGQHPRHASVEEMASHYIEEIRSVQAHGPYMVGGFSFGGLVAYEMAQQFSQRGEETALLVLFDTYPGDLKPNAGSVMRTIFQPSWQHWFHHLPKAAEKKIRRTLRSFRVPQVLKDVRDCNRAAAARYILRPYPGKATLIRATQKVNHSLDPGAAWSRLVGSLEIVEIASDHYEILLEPEVNRLAERLKSCINQARSEYGRTRIAS